MEIKIGFGEILKKRREEKNLSIREVAGDTKLNAKIVTALEEENLQELPEALYIINFIKLYSSYLGLDSRELEALYLAHKNIDKDKFYFGRPTVKEKKRLDTARLKIFYYVAFISVICILMIYLWENFNLGNKILLKRKRHFESNATYELTAPLDIEVKKPSRLSIYNRGVKMYDAELSEKNTYYFNLINGYRLKIEKPENISLYFRKKHFLTAAGSKNIELTVFRETSGELRLKLTGK